jgi:hypothetical protein
MSLVRPPCAAIDRGDAAATAVIAAATNARRLMAGTSWRFYLEFQ